MRKRRNKMAKPIGAPIKNLIANKGLSYQEVAKRCGIGKRSVDKIVAGIEVEEWMLHALATGLGLAFEALVHREEETVVVAEMPATIPITTLPEPDPTPFHFSVQALGLLPRFDDAGKLIKVSQEIAEIIARSGLDVNQFQINMQFKGLDDFTRSIVLLYAVFDNGVPFWIFVAVKTSQYQRFMTAYQEGKVDLYKFDEFGEIIVSGTGEAPPEDITVKVAVMYQTDPDVLFKAIVREREKEKLEQLNHGQMPTRRLRPKDWTA